MQVKAGDIFARDGSFWQVTKATARTVTVRPIESMFIGCADEYGWEHAYIPIRDAFTHDPFWTREQDEAGRRFAVRDFTAGKTLPQISVPGGGPAFLWDGAPSINDRYN